MLASRETGTTAILNCCVAPSAMMHHTRTLYGTCQAAIQFWKKLCLVMKGIGGRRSKADVCLFYDWTPEGLLVYISWVDDILIAGSKRSVMKAKAALKRHFTLDEQGEMQEYVGCKIERDKQQRLEVRILFVTGMCMSVTLLDDGAPWIKSCCHNGTRVCLIVVCC
jgi:hypothetical protein